MLTTMHHAGPNGPLIVAHGLYGSARNWSVIGRRLSDIRDVHAVDMRNHGDSPREDTHDYPGMAADLAEVIEGSDGQADVLGHSMGGKAAMMLALTRPELVSRLIVADIAPVTYSDRQSHHIASMRRVDLATVESRKEAEAQMRVEEPGVGPFLAQSLDLGGRRWKLNLDVLERDMGRIVGWPQVDARFEGPALFVAGETSDYVGAARHEGIRALFPTAEFATISGAGHWLHAERPREFEAAVRGFLTA